MSLVVVEKQDRETAARRKKAKNGSPPFVLKMVSPERQGASRRWCDTRGKRLLKLRDFFGVRGLVPAFPCIYWKFVD